MTSLKKLSPIYMNKYNFVKNSSSFFKEKKVLDIGCGFMEYKEIFDSKCCSYVGVDINPRIAKNKNIVISPAEKLPFKDNSFDFINYIDVIEHVDDPEKTISECYRVLKKQGYMILTTPSYRFPITYDPINAFLRIFSKKIKIGIWSWGHKRLYKEEILKNILKNQKFKIIKFEKRSHFLIAAFVNYIPYLVDKVVKNDFGQKKKKNNLINVIIKPIDHCYKLLNIIDSSLLKNFRGINLCFILKKE